MNRTLVLLSLVSATASCADRRAQTSPTAREVSAASAAVPAAPSAIEPGDKKVLVPAPAAERDSSLRAMAGHWRIVGYDGAPVDDHATPGNNASDTATFMAGSAIDIQGDHFQLRRGANVAVDTPLVVLQESRPGHVVFSIGHGPSTMDLLAEREALVHIDTLPPHDIRLRRD